MTKYRTELLMARHRGKSNKGETNATTSKYGTWKPMIGMTGRRISLANSLHRKYKYVTSVWLFSRLCSYISCYELEHVRVRFLIQHSCWSHAIAIDGKLLPKPRDWHSGNLSAMFVRLSKKRGKNDSWKCILLDRFV